MDLLRQFGFALAVFLAASFDTAMAGPWQAYNAPDYGFSMLVPEGAQLETREWPGGWGGLRGSYQGVTVLGVAKLGAHETAEAIEQFGANLTGIPRHAWEEFDAGADKGWDGYRAVRAELGERIIFGGYGIGPKGSYLVLLETTLADYAVHEDEYETWYESVRLY